MARASGAPPRHSTRRLRAALPWLLVLAAGCGTPDDRRVEQLLPRMSDRAMANLLREDEGVLRDWYAARGEAELGRDFAYVSGKVNACDPADRALLMPHLTRLGRLLDEEYSIGFGIYLPQYYARLDPATHDRVHRLSVEWGELRKDCSLSDSTRVVLYGELLGLFRELGSIHNQVVLLADMGQAHANLGEMDRARAYYLQGLELSEGIDYAEMTCQILGTLAAIEFNAGNMDLARNYLDRLSRRALASRMAQQAARAEVFRGNWALLDERPGTAYLHYQEARRICREFHGGEDEVRYISGLAGFYRRLGCSGIIGSLVDQAEALTRGEGSATMEPFRNNLKLFQAEVLMQEGRVDEALGLAESMAAGVSPRPQPDVYATVRRIYGRLLMEAGRLEEARAVAVDGIGVSARDHMEDDERAFRLLETAILERMGDYETARDSLAVVRWRGTDGPYPPDIAREVLLEVRLCRALEGDGPETAAAVARAIHVLHQRLSADRPSTHVYLEIQEFDELRWIIQAMIADDPALGYAFEMAWRTLNHDPRRCGFLGELASPARVSEVVRAFVDRSPAREGPDLGPGDTHLVYLVTDREVRRWTRRGGEIRAEDLGLEPERLRRLVARALRGLSERPDPATREVPAGLQDDLAELFARLVPDPWGAPGGRLWISPDDALTQVPFATFDRDPGPAYRPLLDAVDVGYLRYPGSPEESGRPEAGPALVVGDPVIAPEWRRRLPGLAPLAGARDEARRIGRKWGTDRVFLGREATKAAILDHWEDARAISIAAHLDRDPETPYLAMIPLAEDPDTTGVGSEILEAADILQADLSGCGLVILSACSSGAPYVAGTRVAPGLGEAFLDAGAGRVVQTLWKVDDQVTRAFMATFMEGEPGADCYLARLNAARRGIRDRGEAWNHPFFWGPYVFEAATVEDRQ